MKVLIADDDPDDREIICDALKDVESQINCVFAKDGLEALNLLTDGSKLPMYIFLDMKMPKMSGLDFLLEIKTNDRLKDIPVVIVTSAFTMEDIKKLMPLLKFKYVSKPNLYQAWVESMREVLKA